MELKQIMCLLSIDKWLLLMMSSTRRFSVLNNCLYWSSLVNSRNIIKDLVLDEWDVNLFVELEDEIVWTIIGLNPQGTLYQISREVPIPSHVCRWVIQYQHNDSFLASELMTNRSTK